MKKFILSFLVIFCVLSASSVLVYGDGIVQGTDAEKDQFNIFGRSDKSIVVTRRGGPSGINNGTIHVYNISGEIIYFENFDTLPVRIVDLDWLGLAIVKVSVDGYEQVQVVM